jgi:ribosomal protein S18 acetylase RimI-like enzyme
MGDFSIRRATPRDEPFLLEMLYEALFVVPGEASFPRSVLDDPDIAHYVKGYGRAGDVGFVAVSAGGQPIGAAWTRQFTGDEPGYGYVDDDTPELSIAVVDEHRGAGLGSQLLARLLEQIPRCSLSVDHRNPAAGLYERLGFKVVERSGRSLTMIVDARLQA